MSQVPVVVEFIIKDLEGYIQHVERQPDRYPDGKIAEGLKQAVKKIYEAFE